MSIIIENLKIPEVKIIKPRRYSDDRGFFCETYTQKYFSDAGINIVFVQDNHAFSVEKGTVRGLHFQAPPFAQAKLIRVIRGAILDIAVDLRVGSPSFGKHVSAIISAELWNQILVPVGFAHGLATLEANTEVLYKVSDFYEPAHDLGLLWNDPALGIDWPVSSRDAILSAKDRAQPRLADLASPFRFEPEGT